MADHVQATLEKMVPELHALMKKHIFSKEEVRAIVKKRTSFEYALRRKQTAKVEYLRYAQYELSLDKLIKTRKSRLGIKKKSSLVDYAGPKHINYIYERALMRYRGDVNLWLKWIEYLKKSGAGKTLGKIITQALQLHPCHSGLWIYACSWEFSENKNSLAARTLMQRALRMNPRSQELWHYYFKQELVYMLKVQERRRILGIDKQEITSRRSLSIPTLSGEEGAATEVPASDAVADNVCSGAVLKAVLMFALKAIPNDVDFCLGFLSSCALANGKVRESLEDAVFAAAQERFPHNPKVLVARAQSEASRAGRGAAGTTAAEAVFAALNSHDASSWEATAKFWHEAAETGSCDGVGAARCLVSACTNAEKSAVASVCAWYLHADCLIRTGHPDEAIIVLKKAIKAHPAAADLWMKLAQIVTATFVVENEAADAAAMVLKEATASCPHHTEIAVEARLRLWRMRVEVERLRGGAVDSLFQEALAAFSAGDDSSRAASVHLRALWLDAAFASAGASGCVAVLLRILAGTVPNEAVWPLVLRVLIRLQVQPSPDIAVMRALLRRAAECCGPTCPDLWLAWLRLERDDGNQAEAATVHWRAMQSLNDTSEFVTACSTMD